VLITNLRLYHFPGVRSARVSWLLHELGQPFELVPIHLFRGDQYSPRFRAVNPAHNLPVLEFQTPHGEKMAMVESGAIVTMLADLWPEAKLAPRVLDVIQRSVYLRALYFCSATLDMVLWQIRVNEEILPLDERDQRSANRYRDKFSAEAEPTLTKILSENDYVCGDVFSAADCMIGHAVMWARNYGLCMSREFEDYLQRLTCRPAFKLAFADTVDSERKPQDLELLRGLFNG
jgi:glutathione S-transferase